MARCGVCGIEYGSGCDHEVHRAAIKRVVGKYADFDPDNITYTAHYKDSLCPIMERPKRVRIEGQTGTILVAGVATLVKY